MINSVRAKALLITAALLSGCAMNDQGAGAQAGAAVTRFHLGQPVPRAEIRVEPANPAEANSLEFETLSTPVERELARLGWALARGNARTEQVAVMRVEQGSRLAGRRGGGSIGVGFGSSTGSYRSGADVGAGVRVPIGGRGYGSGHIVVTELGVRIQRRSDATVFWEGRAQLEARAGSPLADPRAAVDRLAEALFRDFPGESGRTIRIR